MRFLIKTAGLLCLLGAAWVGFIYWYYYLGEGQENAHKDDAYRANLEIQITELHDGLFVLEADGVNATALTGPDGILLVDTGEQWVSSKMVAALEALDSGPIVYVINTHSHGDHRGGNSELHEIGAEILAHAQVAENIKSETYPDTTEADWPTRFLTPNDTFEFNGQTIRLAHFERAHTNSDMVVIFEQANVVAAADILVENGVPYLGRGYGATLGKHIEAQQGLARLIDDQTLLIPGHGVVSDKAVLLDISERLAKTERYIAWLDERGVPRRFMPLFHPLYAWPMSKHTGHGWEKFWLGLVHDGIVSPDRNVPQ